MSKNIRQLKPSGIRKFFDIVNEMEDAISLGVGEPDFDTPWIVREEGIYSIEQGRTFYTSNSGLLELREEICNYLSNKFKLNYSPDEVLVTVGDSEAIDLALRVILDPGDEVLIPQPSYVAYEPCTLLTGAVPVAIPLKEENRFRLTAEDIETYVSDKTKCIILPFPNNPTGSIMEKEDLEEISKVILKYDLIVITDEIYCELTYGCNHVSIASIDGLKERTVYINGFSKSYAMTGWRLGYACAPKEILSQMLKVHQYVIMCAPTISQYAGVKAVRDCENQIVLMRSEYDKRRRFLLDRLRQMGFDCFEPQGAFYIFPSIKSFGMSSEEFASGLLNDQKVAVVPGSAFGECGEGFVRISYAYSLEALKEAMERLEKFVKKIRG